MGEKVSHIKGLTGITSKLVPHEELVSQLQDLSASMDEELEWGMRSAPPACRYKDGKEDGKGDAIDDWLRRKREAKLKEDGQRGSSKSKSIAEMVLGDVEDSKSSKYDDDVMNLSNQRKKL